MYQKFSLFSLPKILDGQNCFKRMIKLSQFLKDTFLKGFNIFQIRFLFDKFIIKLWPSLSSSIWRFPNPIFSFRPQKMNFRRGKRKPTLLLPPNPYYPNLPPCSKWSKRDCFTVWKTTPGQGVPSSRALFSFKGFWD